MRGEIGQLKEELNEEEAENESLRSRQKTLQTELLETKSAIEKTTELAEGLKQLIGEKNDAFLQVTGQVTIMRIMNKKVCSSLANGLKSS